MLERVRGPATSNRLFNAVMRRDSVAADSIFELQREIEDPLGFYPVTIAEWGDDYDFAERAARDQASETRSAKTRLDGYRNLARILVARGRWDEAESALARAARIDARAALTLEALLATLPYLNVPREHLTRIRNDVRSWTPPPAPHNAPPTVAYDRHARLYLLGLLSSKLGDFESALAMADSMRRIPDEARTAVPAYLEATIRADVAWRGAQPPARVFEPLDAMPAHVPAVLWLDELLGLEHARFLRASALLDAGRPQDALGWLEKTFIATPGYVYYRAGVKYLAARALDAMARPADAREARAVFETLWSHADLPIDLPGSAAVPARR